MFRALVALALLAPAVAVAGMEHATPQPGSTSSRGVLQQQEGGRLELLLEGTEGVRMAWTAGRGDGRRVVRLALPPRHHASLSLAGSPAADFAGLPEPLLPMGAAFVASHGFIRRLAFVDIVLDADALPAGPARERWLDVSFVAGAAPTTAPPAVRDDASLLGSVATMPVGPGSAIRSADERLPDGADAGPQAALTGSSDLDDERDTLRSAHFANAGSARQFLEASLRDPAAGPELPARLERGSLRRSLPRGRALSTASSGVDEIRLARAAATGFEDGRVKIVVGPEDGSGRGGAGIYRITGADLQSLGVDLSTVPTADLRLVTHGFQPTSPIPDEVALRVEDGGDGRLSALDWIEFWGEPLLGENVATGWQGLDYSDLNAYVLDATAGARLRMATRDASPRSAASPDYIETVHSERNDIFVGNHRTGQFNVDHYYWCGSPALEWQTGNPPLERVETIPAEGLNAGSARSAAMRVRLLARSGGDHLSEVDLNGILVSSLSGSGSYVENHAASGIAPSALSALTNSVRLRLPGGASSPDKFELDWIELDYPRSFVARSGRLDFKHDPGVSVRVSGLGPGSATVLDVSDHLEPVLLTGATSVSGDLAFELAAPAPAHYAVAVSTAPRPTSVEWIADKGLRDPSLAVDVVLMGPRGWLDPPLPGVSRWVADRQRQGLSVLVTPTEDVIDEFNDGVFSPVALGWMLVDALASWSRPPRYALLLGDTTFDWKDQLAGRALQTSGLTACEDMADPCVANELAWCQHVPTRLFDLPGDTDFLSYYASDAILAMVAGGDWVPDVALGRVPARSAAEAEALLDKVLAYEQLRSAPPPWASRIATCADQMGVGEEEMELSQDDAYAASASPTWPRKTYHYQTDYIDQGRGTRAAFRTDLLTNDWPSITDGFAVVSYAGHGNSFRWSNAALLTNRNGLPPSCEDDADVTESSHVSGGPQPFMVNANCITGSFIAQLGPGLLEEMVRQPNGGIIAGIGPTGITDLANADNVMSSFYGAIHGPEGRGGRAGDILLAVEQELSLGATFDPTELLNTVLLGDPTLQLVVPFGPAAGALRAVGGDARVDLDWDAAPGAVAGTTYNLWRSASASGPWNVVASGLTGLTHADIAAPPTTPDPQNGQRYWYAIEPVSPDGWLGRWSNHADARPCTTDPPAPAANLTAGGSSCGTSITVRWSVSPTPLLQGYRVRVHRGSSATGPIVASSQPTGTFAAFAALVPFQVYTVTVSALSWCNMESQPIEVQVQLTCPAVLGLPEWIPDLHVRRSGLDVVLDWSPVTSNVRGEPLTPTLYRVYRADRPDFFADASREIPTVIVPGTTDAGRIFSGASLEFYAIAAENSGGEHGAVGHDYPQGIRSVTKSDAGSDWQVSWPLVTRDMSGLYTPIASYLVYVRTRAFTDRSDVAGLTPRRVTGPPVLVPKIEGDYHLVVPEDVHGNQSVY